MKSAFQEWLEKTVEGLIPDPEHDPSCAARIGGECECGYVASTLPQRLAIGLVQARALELRNMATQMQLRNLQSSPPGAYLFTRLWDRSHKLEKIGLEMCKTYPPVEGEPTEEESVSRLVQ